MEAMAMGLPTLVPLWGGLTEYANKDIIVPIVVPGLERPPRVWPLFGKIYRVCTAYVPRMCRVCTAYLLRMYRLCTAYVQCMYRICTAYVPQCTVYVPHMYRICSMYRVCTVYEPHMYRVPFRD